MMEQAELDRLWFSWAPIDGVKFGLNDAVEITASEHAGKGGAVIALLSLSPATYLVELASGGDIEIVESDLKLIEKHHNADSN